MVGLIDVAPATEMVEAEGKAVTVHGVSAKGLAHLLVRFPELRRLMTGQEVQADQLLAMGGDAVAAIIERNARGEGRLCSDNHLDVERVVSVTN